MEYTEEQKADAATRAEAFKKEYDTFYQALIAKHQCELVHGLTGVPTPSGIFGFMITEQIGDTKYKPTNAQPNGAPESLIAS